MDGSLRETLIGMDEELAAIYREFCEGLPNRLDRMRSALKTLSAGFDADAADEFYRAAHSLKGTAPAFGAHELASHSATLAETGLRWREDGGLEAAELTAAEKELAQLSDAAKRYSAALEGSAAE